MSISVKEAIVVEGKYDKIKLSEITDGLVIDVGGYGIFGDSAKLEMIQSLAKRRGIIILTDSDRAGFIIRNYIAQSVKDGTVKHAYIPDVYGKESRKEHSSKEGKLGVEGIDGCVLEKAIASAGTRSYCRGNKEMITKSDLYALGLSGRGNSLKARQCLMSELDLPQRMSTNAMLDVLNCIMDRDEFINLACKKNK